MESHQVFGQPSQPFVCSSAVVAQGLFCSGGGARLYGLGKTWRRGSICLAQRKPASTQDEVFLVRILSGHPYSVSSVHSSVPEGELGRDLYLGCVVGTLRGSGRCCAVGQNLIPLPSSLSVQEHPALLLESYPAVKNKTKQEQKTKLRYY